MMKRELEVSTVHTGRGTEPGTMGNGELEVSTVHTERGTEPGTMENGHVLEHSTCILCMLQIYRPGLVIIATMFY